MRKEYSNSVISDQLQPIGSGLKNINNKTANQITN
jgi:hypothetical protein